MLVLILVFLVVVYGLMLALDRALTNKWRAEERYSALLDRHFDMLMRG